MSTDQLDQEVAGTCRSAPAMLRTWARQTPDAPMLTEGATHPHLVRGLRPGQTGQPRPDRGRRLAEGNRVAFVDRNGIEYFEVFFGCTLLGAVSVAVNWRLAPLEMAAIIEDAGAGVLYYGPARRGRRS